MKITNKEELDAVRVRLTIEVDQETFNKAVEDVYKEEKKRISVPGFRKGKAPRKLIEQHYGKDVFYGEAAERAVYPAYAEAVKEAGLDVIAPPSFAIVTLEAGEPFVFTADVDTRQDIKLGEYKGVALEKKNLEVTDEEVDAYLERVRNNTALLETVEGEDATVEEGDITTIDFEGKVDGVAFPGGAATDYELTIGSSAFIPGFEDAMKGMKLGETKDLELTFPEAYHAEDLAGKDVVFTVTVKGIQRRELAELDDEFAKDVSAFETLDEYKADIRRELMEGKEKQAKEEQKGEISRLVTEQTDVIAPQSLVDREAENYMKEMSYGLESQGINLDIYMKLTGTTREALEKQAKEQAEAAVRQQLVLEAIAKEENIEVSEEDLESEYARLASHYGMEADKLKQIFMMQGQADAVRRNMVMEKTVEFLLDNAKIG